MVVWTLSPDTWTLYLYGTNSNSLTIGLRYIQHLFETKRLPFNIRIDHGIETGKLGAIHAFLRDNIGDLDDSTDSVIYGPSTTNKIERWWRDLHERMEMYFKQQLSELLQTGSYDPNSVTDRRISAYIFIPAVQRECGMFKTLWNSHRIRNQQGLELPTGIPSHMFQFPENYGAEDKSFSINTDAIREAYWMPQIITSKKIWEQNFIVILLSLKSLSVTRLLRHFDFWNKNLEGSDSYQTVEMDMPFNWSTEERHIPVNGHENNLKRLMWLPIIRKWNLI